MTALAKVTITITHRDGRILAKFDIEPGGNRSYRNAPTKFAKKIRQLLVDYFMDEEAS